MSSPVLFSQLVNPFLESRKVYNKKRTLDGYRFTSAVLVEFFGKRLIEDLTGDDLQGFISIRKGKGLSANSINRELRVLKVLLRWSEDTGRIEKLPFKIRLLRAPKKRTTKVLGKEEIEKLIQVAHEPFRGIIMVAAYTAFRNEELVNLSWEDIEEDGRITVSPKSDWTPKSHQARSAYVPSHVINYLMKKKERSSSLWVFSNRQGKRYTVTSVCKAVSGIFKTAGVFIEGQANLHRIRSSAATQMLRGGVDIISIQHLLGHESIETTQRYLSTGEEQLRGVAEKLPW